MKKEYIIGFAFFFAGVILCFFLAETPFYLISYGMVCFGGGKIFTVLNLEE